MFKNVAVNKPFPTLLWVIDLEDEVRDRLNEKLVAELDKITGPRGELGIGALWQADQNLHELDASAVRVQRFPRRSIQRKPKTRAQRCRPTSLPP